MLFDPRQIKHLTESLDVNLIKTLLNSAKEAKSAQATVGNVVDDSYVEYKRMNTISLALKFKMIIK